MRKLICAIKGTPEFTRLSWIYVVDETAKSKFDFILGYRKAWLVFFGFRD